jgi:hypothetical protein
VLGSWGRGYIVRLLLLLCYDANCYPIRPPCGQRFAKPHGEPRIKFGVHVHQEIWLFCFIIIHKFVALLLHMSCEMTGHKAHYKLLGGGQSKQQTDPDPNSLPNELNCEHNYYMNEKQRTKGDIHSSKTSCDRRYKIVKMVLPGARS